MLFHANVKWSNGPNVTVTSQIISTPNFIALFYFSLNVKMPTLCHYTVTYPTKFGHRGFRKTGKILGGSGVVL